AEIVVGDGFGDERVIDPLEIPAVDILLRAERSLVEIALGPLIGDRPLAAIERCPVEVALKKILADLGANLLESETDIAEDRIVAPDAVPLLEDVPDADRAQEHGGDERRKEEIGERDEHRENRHAAHAQRNRRVPHPPPLPRLLF